MQFKWCASGFFGLFVPQTVIPTEPSITFWCWSVLSSIMLLRKSKLFAHVVQVWFYRFAAIELTRRVFLGNFDCCGINYGAKTICGMLLNSFDVFDIYYLDLCMSVIRCMLRYRWIINNQITLFTYSFLRFLFICFFAFCSILLSLSKNLICFWIWS